jgi:AcrR family transcriptional regulator
MSMEGVATAAGVGKPTIYRRYRTKRELVIAAVSSLAESLPPPPQTDNVRADLVAFLTPAFDVFQRGLGFAMLGALLVKERDDPELMELFRSRIVRPRMRLVASILRRGVADGQLRADTPVEAAVQIIAGSIFAHHAAGESGDRDWLRLVVDTVWRGLEPRPWEGEPQ